MLEICEKKKYYESNTRNDGVACWSELGFSGLSLAKWWPWMK